MQMPNFYSRDRARDRIRERGVPIGEDGLKDHASRGTGPRYSIVNGRAVYTAADLDSWIEAQAARPVTRRVKREVAQAAA